MSDTGHYDITLVIDWPTLANGESLRRNTTGFGTIKNLIAASRDNEPLEINAFLYAFLVSAKNINLFLKANDERTKAPIQTICDKMNAIARLEREGTKPEDDSLLRIYKRTRLIAARPNTRDEQRTLATLLFSGPSTPEQIEADLGIDKNLVARIFRALSPLIEQTEADSNRFVLRSDHNSLAVTLYLLQYTLGLEPVRVLQSQNHHCPIEE